MMLVIATWVRRTFALVGQFAETSLRRMAASDAGATAVEFAIVLPVAILIYAGAAEVADAVMTSRKVTTVTKTLVDLTSQQGTTTQTTSTPTPANAMSAASLSALLTSAATLIAPQPASPLTMTISAIDVTNTSNGTCCSALVRWSYTQGGTLRPCTQQLTALSAASDYSASQIPAALLPTGTPMPAPLSIIIADVSYVYQPIMSLNILSFAAPMQRTEYMLPRSTGQVATGALPVSGSQYGKVCY
jgi:Flp pilus assembly protein TadG